MIMKVNRREFSKTVALGLGATLLPAATAAQAPRVRKFNIGHTGITWRTPAGNRSSIARGGVSSEDDRGARVLAGAPPEGAAPQGRARSGAAGGRAVNAELIEMIFRDLSSLGFYGVELFGSQVTEMEASGGIGAFVKQYNLPLISIVSSPNCGDPSRLKESIQNMVSQATVAKKYGCKIILMNASGGRRDDNFNFNANKANIINALNEAAKAMADLGLQAVLHPHDGTMVEKRDEIYAVCESMDTRVVKLAPDVGHITKGGSDPIPIIRDFLPLIEHFHLKDYSGGEHYMGFCPLGQGRVNLAAALDLIETKESLKGMIMVELNASPEMPLTTLEAVRVAKTYLEKQGYKFRA